MTMTLIAHQELTSAQASITFSSIPQTYDDLLLVVSARAQLASGYSFDDLGIRINGDSGSNYANRLLRTRDGSVGSFSGSGTSITFFGAPALSATSGTFGSGQAYFPAYYNSETKSVTCEGYSENNSGSAVQGGINGGIWNNTAPITSIQIASLNNWNFVQYSSATLFGITAGNPGGVTVS